MRDPMTNLIIECYALYQSPQQVVQTLRDKYKENCPTYYSIRQARERYRQEILDKREELETNIAILNSKERWGYVQFILDKALEEEPVFNMRGDQTGVKRDLKNALQAIKIANEMSNTVGAVIPENDDIIRSIVIETFDELRKAKPKANNEEIVQELLNSLGSKAAPYVQDLREKWLTK